MHPSGMGTIAIGDAELASLALGGDVAALADLLERRRPMLYATAVSLLGNRADALDAVQDTFVIALVRLADLRDPKAAPSWLHAVLRNVCLTRIRQRREVASENIEVPDTMPGPEAALERHIMGEWVWHALEGLSPDERVTIMLRYFTRCTSYDAIARVTSTPIGTVRSRLNRARRRLSDILMATADGSVLSHVGTQVARQMQWEEFYRVVHERPVARTYAELFAPDVDVRDPGGLWRGVEAWSAEERAAITLGVRATILGVLAASDITVVEIDFANPPAWPDHCPPHATFVHRLSHGRSRQLRIHYPRPAEPLEAASAMERESD